MHPKKTIFAQLILFLTGVVAFVWMLAGGALAGTLLYVADTNRGRMFAYASLLAAILPLAITLSCRRSARSARNITLCIAILWLATVGQTLLWAPKGSPEGRQRVSNVFDTAQEPSAAFSRFSIPNLVPEGDQLLLGLQLVPLVDPLINRADATNLQKLTRDLYRELEADTDFNALGSTMALAYDRILNPDASSPHSYVYVPEKVWRDHPRPVLVFFHGSGGNFKVYLWILSKLADKLNCVLVAPSGGFGNWTSEESEAGFQRALAAAASQTAIDLDQVHIIGLSNGGLAISQLTANPNVHVASITFLSPVFDTPQTLTATFAKKAVDHPVLVITGATDNRVPLDYVEANIANIMATGANVTTHIIPNADHFALFSHREKVLALLETWFVNDQP